MIINITLEVVLENFRVEILWTTEHPNSGLIDCHRLIQRHPLNFMVLNSRQPASVVFLEICYRNSKFLFVQGSLQNNILFAISNFLSFQKTIFMELGLNPLCQLLNFNMSSLDVGDFLRHACFCSLISTNETKKF